MNQPVSSSKKQEALIPLTRATTLGKLAHLVNQDKTELNTDNWTGIVNRYKKGLHLSDGAELLKEDMVKLKAAVNPSTLNRLDSKITRKNVALGVAIGVAIFVLLLMVGTGGIFAAEMFKPEFLSDLPDILTGASEFAASVPNEIYYGIFGGLAISAIGASVAAVLVLRQRDQLQEGKKAFETDGAVDNFLEATNRPAPEVEKQPAAEGNNSPAPEVEKQPAAEGNNSPAPEVETQSTAEEIPPPPPPPTEQDLKNAQKWRKKATAIKIQTVNNSKSAPNTGNHNKMIPTMNEIEKAKVTKRRHGINNIGIQDPEYTYEKSFDEIILEANPQKVFELLELKNDYNLMEKEETPSTARLDLMNNLHKLKIKIRDVIENKKEIKQKNKVIKKTNQMINGRMIEIAKQIPYSEMPQVKDLEWFAESIESKDVVSTFEVLQQRSQQITGFSIKNTKGMEREILEMIRTAAFTRAKEDLQEYINGMNIRNVVTVLNHYHIKKNTKSKFSIFEQAEVKLTYESSTVALRGFCTKLPLQTEKALKDRFKELKNPKPKRKKLTQNTFKKKKMGNEKNNAPIQQQKQKQPRVVPASTNLYKKVEDGEFNSSEEETKGSSSDEWELSSDYGQY